MLLVLPFKAASATAGTTQPVPRDLPGAAFAASGFPTDRCDDRPSEDNVGATGGRRTAELVVKLVKLGGHVAFTYGTG